MLRCPGSEKHARTHARTSQSTSVQKRNKEHTDNRSRLLYLSNVRQNWEKTGRS